MFNVPFLYCVKYYNFQVWNYSNIIPNFYIFTNLMELSNIFDM